jgi:hypothetical protein
MTSDLRTMSLYSKIFNILKGFMGTAVVIIFFAVLWAFSIRLFEDMLGGNIIILLTPVLLGGYLLYRGVSSFLNAKRVGDQKRLYTSVGSVLSTLILAIVLVFFLVALVLGMGSVF